MCLLKITRDSEQCAPINKIVLLFKTGKKHPRFDAQKQQLLEELEQPVLLGIILFLNQTKHIRNQAAAAEIRRTPSLTFIVNNCLLNRPEVEQPVILDLGSHYVILFLALTYDSSFQYSY